MRTSKTLLTLSVLCVALAAPAFAQTNPQAAPAAALPECRALGLSTCPQPFDARLPHAADMLTWDTPTRVIGFRNTYRLYQGDVFHTRGATPYPLPAARYPLPAARYPMPAVHFTLDGAPRDLDAYLREQSVTGLLILKDGHVAYEYYGAGNTDQTLWTSRSVAKSVVSILLGIAIKEGLIHSLADPVTHYLPELTGTAWDGVRLQELLQHTSGVAWNEHYADPSSDFAALTHCEAAADAYACVMHLVTHLQRVPGVQPGQVWSYNTAGAWLLGLTLERATHMTLARYLEARLWSRFAMQSDGVWEALVKDQVDMGGHGFNATLRDWGRFALFVGNGGTLQNGETLLPADWIAQSTTWTQARNSVTPDTPDGQFGYQWWYGGIDHRRTADGDVSRTARQTFWAEGIYGQTLAINPTEKLEMVQWSTWPGADGPPRLYDEQVLFFHALAQALHGAH